jgi:outer membrane scaffolding protein for murein synthesis (MipA/OmpV family)
MKPFRYASRINAMKHFSYALLPLLALAYLPSLAFADDTTLDLGGAVMVRPAYTGSDDYRTNILPYIGFENLYGFDMRGLAITSDVIELGTGKGPGRWSLEAGPRVSFDFGRDSRDSVTLEGLDDINPSLLLGGFTRATIGIIGFDLSVGQDVIGGHKGLVADASIGTRYPGKGWFVAPLVSVSWADQNFTQEIYGISEAQTATSALDQFDTDSGFHQVSASLLAGIDIDDDWSVTGLVSYREALGDYRDSPIIQAEDGSASGIFATVGIARRFSF